MISYVGIYSMKTAVMTQQLTNHIEENYRPRQSGAAAFLAACHSRLLGIITGRRQPTHRWYLPTATTVPANCNYGTFCLHSTHVLESEGRHTPPWAEPPPFPILVNHVRLHVLSILRYTLATRPEAVFQPPHLPPLLAEVLGLE